MKSKRNISNVHARGPHSTEGHDAITNVADDGTRVANRLKENCPPGSGNQPRRDPVPAQLLPHHFQSSDVATFDPDPEIAEVFKSFKDDVVGDPFLNPEFLKDSAPGFSLAYFQKDIT